VTTNPADFKVTLIFDVEYVLTVQDRTDVKNFHKSLATVTGVQNDTCKQLISLISLMLFSIEKCNNAIAAINISAVPTREECRSDRRKTLPASM